jgi:hypothetical protein
LLAAAGAAAYYFLVYRPAHQPPLESAYVLADTLEVFDSPARVRLRVATAKAGDRVDILERSRDWVRLRLAEGTVGWAEAAGLVDAGTYGRGQKLLAELKDEFPQAAGHLATVANLRLEPSRDAPQLDQLSPNQKVEVFGRQMVDRPPQPNAPPSSAPLREAWYLIRADSRAGWLLGRFVSLDIPDAISMYAQSANIVAWLVLDTVDDDGRQVPQYLTADRSGSQEIDFSRIRVFTWWAARQQYATSYVESNLNGFFPIRVRKIDGVPHFRLRLEDRRGNRFQKVYAMHGNVVRPVGTVPGWESEELPERPAAGARRVR